MVLNLPELPLEIWKDRIDNEINGLKRLNIIEENSIVQDNSSVEFFINIKAIGFAMKYDSGGLDLVTKDSHHIFLKINRSFPYPGGIDFAWYSIIFHPNIHPIELPKPNKKGTGYICLNVLKKWSRLSDLETTIKALQRLIENPNPDDPLKYDICLEAAEFFKKNTMEDLKIQYNIKNEKTEEKVDDITILDD